jgi:alpha-mannosidase
MAWVNGEKVFETRDLRGLAPDQDAIPIKLESGWNRLLVKAVNNGVDFGVSVKIRANTRVEFSVENPLPRSGHMLVLPARGISGFGLTDGGELGVVADVALKNDSDKVIGDPGFTFRRGNSAVTAAYDRGPLQPGETRRAVLVISDPVSVFQAAPNQITWISANGETGEIDVQTSPGGWLLLRNPIPLPVDDGRVAQRVHAGPEVEGFSARLILDVQSGKVEVDSPNGKVTLGPGVNRVELASALAPGRMVDVSARGTEPGAEFSASLQFYHPDLDLVAENLHFAQLLGELKPEEMQQLEQGFIASRGKDGSAFEASAKAAADKIRAIAPTMKQYTLDLIGHAHIDMAWLWRIPETTQVCRNTFGTMLKIMDETPDFKFAQSQMAAYEWMEKENPEIFGRIKEKVASGQWVPVGGMWIEPDVNIPSGESLVRQHLLGKTYCREKFGVDVKVGWLPDTFGHSWQMPQILKKCGIEGYVFGRCNKPDTPLFWWEAPDGSRVLGYWTSGYNGAIRDSVADDVLRFAKDCGRKEELYLHGVGDHGGGPTYEDLANYKRLTQCAAAPTVRYQAPQAFFDKQIADGQDLPVVRDEMGFIFEGCYTTRSDTKRQNRKLEVALKQAETLAAIAGEKNANERLVPAWKTLCFNQFHDIICGSAIHEVYDDANAIYADAFDLTHKVTDDALHAIVGESGGKDTITVFNTCEWERGGEIVFERPASLHGDAGIFLADESGPKIPVRARPDGKLEAHVPAVPACGSETLRAVIAMVDHARPAPKADEIENEHLRVKIDPESGRIASLVDKTTGRECLSGSAQTPLLRMLGDAGDGWVISYTSESTPIGEQSSVKDVSDDVAQTIRVEGGFGASHYAVDYILYPGDPKLYIKLAIDWREHGQLLKMDFPFAVDTPRARFEIPFGSIEGPTDANERPMQRWLSLRGSDGCGVAVLNDCKYGCSVDGGTASVTLLRSTTSPDTNPDEGQHQILLGLLPLEPETSDGAITRQAQEINEPLLAAQGSVEKAESPSWVSVDKDGLFISAVKAAEDGEGVIVRLYEVDGQPTDAALRLWAPVVSAVATDMLEQGDTALETDGATVKLHFSPWEIKTIRVHLHAIG